MIRYNVENEPYKEKESPVGKVCYEGRHPGTIFSYLSVEKDNRIEGEASSFLGGHFKANGGEEIEMAKR